jgi:hypothetical protein
MIKKSKSSYKVTSKSGKTLGTHKTKKAATRQLRAIEASKHRRGR